MAHPKSLSNSLSDFIFGLSSIYLTVTLSDISPLLSVGGLILSTANFLGTLRFIKDRDEGDLLLFLHMTFSSVSALIGLPLINFGLGLYMCGYEDWLLVLMMVCVVCGTVLFMMDVKSDVLAAVGFLSMFVIGGMYIRIGIAVILVGSIPLAKGDDAPWKIDCFHSAFTVGNLFYIYALQ